MDKHTKQQRSFNMSRVKSSGTEFEKAVFREIRKHGIHFRMNYRKVTGKPDIALPKSKRAIFLHSDFWHGWQFPRWKNILPSKFWREKIQKNRARDKKVKNILRRSGWDVMVIWEHSIKNDPKAMIRKIVNYLK